MIQGYYLAVAAFALLVFLLYKEWTRKKKSGLYGRLLASIVAVASLWWMAWPYPEENRNGALKKLIILTDGFVKDSVDDFLQQQHAAIPVYTAAPELGYAGHTTRLIGSWTKFLTEHAADTLHVFGNGFNETTLALLNAHPIVFHAMPAAPAVSSIYWKQALETGELLQVQGAYENSSAKKIKILLEAFNEGRDSVFIDAGASSTFSLKTLPLHNGKAVYKLLFLSGKDTLQQEPVPVDVQTVAPLQLLIISSAPDFDNTYLKNHLSQQGYQVTLRTAISTNKSERQFLNTPVQPAAGALNTAYLSKFDVLMADQEALQKMSGPELAALRSVIAGKGTGLLVKMDGQKNTAAFYARFFPVKAVQQDNEVYRWLQHSTADSNRYKIKITEPLAIVYQPGQQIILQDAQSNIYAAAVLYGSGKIIASTLQNTFSMALAGDKAAYQQLWWLLLNRASRKIYPDEIWHTNPLLAFKDQPVLMQLETTNPLLPKAIAGNSTVYLSQDALLPFARNGVYWPEASGWQAFPQLQAVSGHWYVYKKGDWQQMFNYQHTYATKKYMASHPLQVNNETHFTANHFMANRQLWLLLIFLAACIFLWVEQKAG